LSFLFYWIFPIVYCQDALILDAENSSFFVQTKQLKQLNLDGSSFSAAEIGDQLIWVSYDDKKVGRTHYYSEGSGFSLYKAPLKTILLNGEKLVNAQKWNPLNSDNAIYGSISSAYDPELIFFTAAQKKNFRGQSNNLGIFYQSGLNGSGRANLLPFIDVRYNYCHPAWDSKTQRLFFSSDMDSPSGRMSIYYSEYAEGVWSKPNRLNLEGFSTNSNEIFPFINEKGLFFSSDRAGGLGGLDIYFAKRDKGGFALPLLLAPPFNSEADDFGIWFPSSNTRGYFSSNRTNGQDVIFAFDCGADCFTAASVVKSLDLTVLSKLDLSPIRGAKVYLLPESRLLKEIENGNLRLAADGGLLGVDLAENWLDAGYSTNAITGREGKVLLEKRSIEKVFYALVRKENYLAVFEKISFEDGFSHLHFEIELVPDCLHMTFSFISEGGAIQEDVNLRLSESNVGEIMKLTVSNGVFRTCLNRTRNYLLEAESEGYHNAEISFSTHSTDKNAYALFLPVVEREEVSEGTVLELRNIYYEYNSHEIVQEAAKELDELAMVMKLDTTMVIELRAHTDSRGSADYNLQLSGKRAESAKDYLMNLGIQSDRVLTSGKGQTELRNHCEPGVPCSEEEHAFNRRTEVFVIRAGAGIQAIRDGSGGVRFIID